MEKQCVTGFQFNIHQFHCFQRQVYIMLRSAHLLAGKTMFNASHFVRAFYYLQATIGFVGFCNGYHYGDHLVRQ